MQIASPNIYLIDQGGNTLGPNNQLAGIDVQGTLWTQGGTWSFSTIPYVIRNPVAFQAGAPLTIQAGTVIMMLGPTRELDMQAPLYVLGTSSAPVVFTSVRDSSVGGDTDLFEGNLNPAPNDWRTVVLDGPGASGSQLNNAVIRYGSAGGGFGDQTEFYIVASTGVVISSSR